MSRTYCAERGKYAKVIAMEAEMKEYCVTQTNKKVIVHKSNDGYVTMVECQTALDNIGSNDVREFAGKTRPGTVLMRGAAWEFHSVWNRKECERLGVKMPKGF